MDAIALRHELLQLFQNTATKPSKYNRGHVFESILDFAKKEISKEESLSMMYCFHLYQRVLKSSQHGRLRLAKGFAKEAEEFNTEFSLEVTNLGMRSLYHPAIGYYYYVSEDYDRALKEIRASYEPIHELYHLGLKEAILMKIEQVTNEFRVLYSMGREAEAMDIAGKLVSYVLSGKTDPEVFPFSLDEVMPDTGEREVLSSYVIDCLLFKWVGQAPKDTSKTLQNLTKILEAYPNSTYYRMAQNLKEIQNSGIEKWLSKRDLAPFFHDVTPSMVKLLAIYFAFSYIHVEGAWTPELEKAFEDYNEKITRIPEVTYKPLLEFASPVHI